MKHIAPPPLTEHRCSRLLAWGRLLLTWVWAFKFAQILGPISERHLWARALYVDLDKVAVMVSNIILLHAFAKLKSRGDGRPFTLRDHSANGFARRTRVRNIRRAYYGAWLRHRLNHRDPLQRFIRIVTALDQVDTLAARVARRITNGLTRLFALRAVRPPHARVCSLAAPAVATADSS